MKTTTSGRFLGLALFAIDQFATRVEWDFARLMPSRTRANPSFSDVLGFPLLVLLTALVVVGMPLTAHGQIVDNIEIGPNVGSWQEMWSLSGGLTLHLPLRSGGQCRIRLDRESVGSGNPTIDFSDRWNALAGASSNPPDTIQKPKTSGWISLFGERSERSSSGRYRTLALFTITKGARTQSVAASANDERCLPPLKTLLKTVVVMNSVGNDAAANGNESSMSAATAGSPSSSTANLRPQDLIGRWYGLKTSMGVTLYGDTGTLMRQLLFRSDGTYILEQPYDSSIHGRYEIRGNTVTLPNLYVLTFKNGALHDGYGVLVRKSQ